MKLGIFDSGLGGLVIARAVRDALPDVDIMYYGDTLHLPYGNRSDQAIYDYTRVAMDTMFAAGCSLIVIACNTASAAALRRLQQTWLGKAWPGRNIIGVVVPTLEAAIQHGHKKLGLIGTNYTVRSGIFREELQKIDPEISMTQVATPLLVALIENDGWRWAEDVLRHYLAPMQDDGIECLMLGCTHYPALKSVIRQVLGEEIEILSQDEIIPAKLADYLARHPEYDVGSGGADEFYVSDLTENYLKAAWSIYGKEIEVKQL